MAIGIAQGPIDGKAKFSIDLLRGVYREDVPIRLATEGYGAIICIHQAIQILPCV